jgi:hypothetical protein
MGMVTEGYDQDFYAWAMKNAELIRQGRFTEIDAEHIAEELESMGKSEKRELSNRLAVLLAQLLKWKVQRDSRQLHANSWRATVEVQRLEVAEVLQDNPSLRHGLKDRLPETYRKAVWQAVKDTGLEKQAFPATCPFTLEQVMDEDFWPD